MKMYRHKSGKEIRTDSRYITILVEDLHSYDWEEIKEDSKLREVFKLVCDDMYYEDFEEAVKKHLGITKEEIRENWRVQKPEDIDKLFSDRGLLL